jgi:hypothetical protein
MYRSEANLPELDGICRHVDNFEAKARREKY